jgi:peptidoglycan/LPS O-acetylase OafA/YrhL
MADTRNPIEAPRAAGRSTANWFTKRLSRITSSGVFITEVDGLRFVAIMSVVLMHQLSSFLNNVEPFGAVNLPADYPGLMKQDFLIRLLRYGDFGVPLFFLISGFVLALPFARARFESAPRPSLKAYYLRRLTRLEPTYVISLTLCGLYYLLTAPSWDGFVPRFLASIFYSNNLVYGDFSPINGVVWTLEVEIHFYLIAPAVAAIFAIRDRVTRRATLLGLVVLFGLFAQFVIWPTRDFTLRHSLLNYFQYFLAGYLLADLFLERGADAPTSLRNDSLTLVAGGAILIILWDHRGWLFLLPLFAMQLCWGVFTGTVSRAVMRWTPIYLVGGMCYTIYLYHVTILKMMIPSVVALFASSERPFKVDFLLCAAVQTTLIVAICAVLFVVAERPFMKNWAGSWRARRQARRHGPAHAYGTSDTNV